MTWHEGRLWAFDTETTSPDPHTARIVSASLVGLEHGVVCFEHDWLINPGVEIPQEATNVHGITTYKAESEGVQPLTALIEMSQILRTNKYPLVVFNAAFDLTLLDAELERNNLEPIRDYRPVIDPFVIDKQAERYRKGKRNLAAVCGHYGVTLGAAHTASADALAAAQVAIRLGELYPEHDNADRLHDMQIKWRAEQSASLEQHFRKTNPEATVAGGWPIQEAA